MRPLAAACVLALALVAGCSSEDTEPGNSALGSTYVALGECYTAASGVPETVDAGCVRSSNNYPALVAEELDLALTDVSCGSATTT